MNMLFNQFCLQCLFKIRAVRDVFLIVFLLRRPKEPPGWRTFAAKRKKSNNQLPNRGGQA